MRELLVSAFLQLPVADDDCMRWPQQRNPRKLAKWVESLFGNEVSCMQQLMRLNDVVQRGTLVLLGYQGSDRLRVYVEGTRGYYRVESVWVHLVFG